jgi:urease accessory protein
MIVADTVTSIPTITVTGRRMSSDRATSHIYRIAAWLSPAFPVGAYTYSSGLEYAVEAKLVMDSSSLECWLSDLFRIGSGAVDGSFFSLAHRAATADDGSALSGLIEWADALRPTAELAMESAAQGEAFLKTIRQSWPHEKIDSLVSLSRQLERKPAYPVAVGATCGYHGIPLDDALTAFLHAMAANLISAAVRIIPLGQTDGQRITAAIEPLIAGAIETIRNKTLDDLGSATPMIDWASMQHETQYTRLFRS